MDLEDPKTSSERNEFTTSTSHQNFIVRGSGHNKYMKFSNLIKARTELNSIDKTTPDPPESLSKEAELSGMAYWCREASLAQEHGGDYAKRHESVFRAALGSFATFAVLVLPNQNTLGCVWIGAIFFHANVKDSFGAAFDSARGFAFSTLVTSTD